MTEQDPPGLDLGRAAPYLSRATDGALAGPLTASVISGGRSNLTYLVGDGTRTVVVRRPPLGHVLPSAHDMTREYTVISALAKAGFPVPGPLLLCTDPDAIGAPFYVMDYVDGVVLRRGDEATPDQAVHCGRALVDLLVRLHGIDHEAIGLADFGRPDGYLERQVRRWHQQWERSKTRELPALERVSERLAKELPASQRAGIVHGDYRLDNVMFDRKLERIDAVMDWEMATIGDPLADVGLMVVYTDLAQLRLTPPVPDGFPTGAELAARYAATTGLDAAHLDWYVAFGNFKLAVIAEGIHARFLQGKTVGAGFEAFGPSVPVLIDRAEQTLGE